MAILAMNHPCTSLCTKESLGTSKKPGLACQIDIGFSDSQVLGIHKLLLVVYYHLDRLYRRMDMVHRLDTFHRLASSNPSMDTRNIRL
jgi:hypothetical protein